MNKIINFWNKLFIGFINGIVLLLPLVITVAIVRYLVIKVNNFVLNPLLNLISFGWTEVQHVIFVKALILMGVITAISFIGWAARVLFINRFFSFWENILIRVPILGKIYNAIKQISSAFIGQGKTIFKQVVLIEYPRKGLYSLGFTTGVTRGEIKSLINKNGINVFVPTTPNPTSGVFIVVSREDIQFLKMSVEEGMKLIVSGGSVTPLFEGGDK